MFDILEGRCSVGDSTKKTVVSMFAALYLLFLAGCSATGPLDGGETIDPAGSAGNVPLASDDAVDNAVDNEAPVDPGEAIFLSVQSTGTDSTAAASCAQCHGTDGSGDRAASIRNLDATRLQAHAQGDAFHPALSGGRVGRVPEIKFPELDAADFSAIAAFLADN